MISILLAMAGDSFFLASSVNACPRDISVLTGELLEELPSYTNRVRARLGLDSNTYLIIAGRAEFEPLPLNSSQIEPSFEEVPTQIFFTTLERTYRGNQVIDVQNYHWLMLVETNGGWQLFNLFSRLGSQGPSLPPDPPRESSQSAIAQGITLWLRDCNAQGG